MRIPALSAAVVLLLALVALGAAERSPSIGLPTLELARAFPALTFARPVLLTHAGDGSGQVYVVEQRGVIHRIDPAAPEQTEVFLDISAAVSRRGNEEGLLGLAFDPGFVENGRFYVHYSAASPRRSALSRFDVGPNGRGDPASEFVLLEEPQPYSNHNGGMIAFGPDGMLYAAFGDGGSAGDPQRHGQNLGTLLGAIIRIDVSQAAPGAPYAVPPDNPFVGQDGARGEIWAYGLRNPWRFSFDRATGDLWAGDVGQNALEEVDIVRRGGNYGWSAMEGSRCFRASSCDATAFESPVAEYGRELGCSVTGGYVYRGQRLPDLHGVYLYADFCSGRIWGLRYDYDGGRVAEQAQLARAGFQIASFGEDESGEVYALGFDGGIYTLADPSAQPAPPSVPTPTRDSALSAVPTRDGAPTVMPAASPTWPPGSVTPAPWSVSTVEPPGTLPPPAEHEPPSSGEAHLPAMSSDGVAWGVAVMVGLAVAAVALLYVLRRRRRGARP